MVALMRKNQKHEHSFPFYIFLSVVFLKETRNAKARERDGTLWPNRWQRKGLPCFLNDWKQVAFLEGRFLLEGSVSMGEPSEEAPGRSVSLRVKGLGPALFQVEPAKPTFTLQLHAVWHRHRRGRGNLEGRCCTWAPAGPAPNLLRPHSKDPQAQPCPVPLMFSEVSGNLGQIPVQLTRQVQGLRVV